jgi:hypothetical protein
MSARWLADLDALAFVPAGHQADCLVHRRALGTLIGRGAEAEAALAFYAAEQAVFERAAAAKIASAGLAGSVRFHLTSRDIARARASQGDVARASPGDVACASPGDVAVGTESAGPILDSDPGRH